MPFPVTSRRARLPLLLPSVLLSAFLSTLSACGGGAGSGNGAIVVVAPTPPVTVPASLRGTLIGTPTKVPLTVGGATISTVDPTQFAQLLEAVTTGTTNITGTPTCAVTMYTVHYHTLGGAGEDTDASTAVMVPSGTDSVCQGGRPVLLYAHGTTVQKSSDMANLAATEPRLVAAMFAAQGYVVVAPNYAGYAGSSLGYHPYLDGTQQATDMIDGLRAARAAFATIGVKDAGRLMISGYSQGGYVALATQRAMQLQYGSEFTVSAAAPLSGPYALTQFGDSIFGGAPTMGSSAFVPMLINAAQHAGAGIYTSTSDIYEPKYASGIADLLPGTLGLGDLVAAGKLPNDVLFAQDSLPQTAGYSAFFGADHLIKTSYRNTYLADMQANPCSQNNATPLGCAPTQPLRKWLLKNDLRNYLPAPPLLMCGGNEDPLVPFINTAMTGAYFTALGKPSSALTVLDLDGAIGTDSYSLTRTEFLAAKGLVRINAFNAGGAAAADKAVSDAYHAGLVAPFCMRAARAFFNVVPTR